MKRKIVIFLSFILILGGAVFYGRFTGIKSREILTNTWRGYKHFFINADGRLMRPKDKDTVSEAQGYAMLRAVWMGDKQAFDRCYRWTENNLSRAKTKGDNLLAWHWKDGRVIDWMPASDADIDYALSLILAEKKWPGRAPAGLDDYGLKAKNVLKDIIRLETSTTARGRVYLLPWVIENKTAVSSLPINPSYYSPAHFRIFYEFTKDGVWLKLADTTYYILNSLSREFNGQRGKGLIPDWCSVDSQDKFFPLEGKSCNFGWEAVRVPLRVGLDYLWFGAKDAKAFFNSGLSKFIEEEWKNNKMVFCEYDYRGQPVNKYENPLFYAAYYCALRISDSRLAVTFLNKTRGYLKRYGRNWAYLDKDEYYVNSLAWISEIILPK